MVECVALDGSAFAPFIRPLSIIAAGLLAGYAIQRIAGRRIPDAPAALALPRRVLQIVALLVLNPIATISTLWVFTPADPRVALLPLLGVLTICTGGTLGFGLTRLRRMERRQAGAFFVSSAFSNMGSIGALLVFLFLGEPGFALVPLYRLFEELCYYALGFPIAKSFGDPTPAASRARRIRRILLDPFILVTLGAIAVGFACNASGIRRPAAFTTLNAAIIPAASFLLLVSIGMAMRFGSVRRYLREALLVSGVKFMAVPAVITGTALLFGLGRFDHGIALKVALILSSMPVAFTALVPPALYGLDVDLANSCWLVSTSFLVLVVPAQMLLISLV